MWPVRKAWGGRLRGSPDAATIDAVLYTASAAFAAVTAGTSSMLTHRMWGTFATLPYATGALIALRIARGRGRGPTRQIRARTLLALAVLMGATITPLVAAVVLRAERGDRYAQSETHVIEQAAAAAIEGRNPYSANFGGSLSPAVRAHFPYLPLMAVLGVPRAAAPRTPLSDARVVGAVAALALAVVALRRWPTGPEKGLRAFQLLVVFPTGALAIVASGHDIPVLGLLLLALVLRDNARPWASALAAGSAALMKATAWPLMLMLGAAALVPSRTAPTHERTRPTPEQTGVATRAARRARSTSGAAAVAVVLLLLPIVAWAPADFAQDTIRFPLGLSHLRPPSSDATAGSVLLAAAGAPDPTTMKRALMVGALLILALALGRLYVRARPVQSTAAAAQAAGLVLVLLFALAPVARPGYWSYPVSLVWWGALLKLRPGDPPSGAPRPVVTPRESNYNHR